MSIIRKQQLTKLALLRPAVAMGQVNGVFRKGIGNHNTDETARGDSISCTYTSARKASYGLEIVGVRRGIAFEAILHAT